MTLQQSVEQGNLALQASNWELALIHWRNVYMQMPHHPWAGVTLGLTLFKLNRFDEAIPYLLEDIVRHSDRELAFIHLAKISQANEDWELNAQQWSVICVQFPDYEWAMSSYANALKQLREVNKAERYFHMDVMRYPQHKTSYHHLIAIAIEKQQFRLAQRRLDALLEQFPDDTKAYKAYIKILRRVQSKYIIMPEYEDYMICFTSDTQQKFMGMEIPKVASTTLVARLYQQFLKTKPPTSDHHRLIADFEDDHPYDPVAYDYFKFTIVRHPYTRILSAYLDKIMKPARAVKFRPPLGFGLPDVEDVSFADFLRRIKDYPMDEVDPHFQPQSLILGLHDPITYDYIIRFEHLEDGLQALLHHISGDEYDGSNTVSRRPHATNAGEKLQQYYGEEEKALVAEIYGDDFKYLGYGFDWNLI